MNYASTIGKYKQFGGFGPSSENYYSGHRSRRRRRHLRSHTRRRTNISRHEDDPRNAHLFSRDRDKSGKPYCLRCKRSGHTLDVRHLGAVL